MITHSLGIFVVFYLIMGKVLMVLKCENKPTSTHEFITGVTIEPSKEKKALRAPFSNIRIYMHYATNFSDFKDSEHLKKKVIEPAVQSLESMIKVKNPNNGILRGDRVCTNNSFLKDSSGEFGCSESCLFKTTCGNNEIPMAFLKKCRVVTPSGKMKYNGNEGKGLKDYDIVVIVGTKYCTGATFGMAGSCDLDKELDRPIISYISLCHDQITGIKNTLSSIEVFKHQLIHALGFSADRYAFYRNSDGTPIVPRDNNNLPNLGTANGYYLWNDKVAKKVFRSRSNIHYTYQKEVLAFTLPNILKVTRKHFNCPTLDGVDLAVSVSHFSEYVFFNEIMTSDANFGIDQMTIFTLALLKDTGWYDVDYRKVEKFSYGKKKGCSFLLEGCYKYMQNQKARNLSLLPFCDQLFTVGNIYKCSENRKFYYFCNIIKHKTLDPQYQYFNNMPGVQNVIANNYGGLSPDYEYCPSMHLSSDPSSVCNDEENNDIPEEYNIIQSYYGPDSLCFLNGYFIQMRPAFYGASCQKYFYDFKKKILKVFFPKQTAQCPSKTVFIIDGIKDNKISFVCPDLSNFNNITIRTTDKLATHSEVIDRGIKVLCLIVMIYVKIL